MSCTCRLVIFPKEHLNMNEVKLLYLIHFMLITCIFTIWAITHLNPSASFTSAGLGQECWSHELEDYEARVETASPLNLYTAQIWWYRLTETETPQLLYQALNTKASNSRAALQEAFQPRRAFILTFGDQNRLLILLQPTGATDPKPLQLGSPSSSLTGAPTGPPTWASLYPGNWSTLYDDRSLWIWWCPSYGKLFKYPGCATFHRSCKSASWYNWPFSLESGKLKFWITGSVLPLKSSPKILPLDPRLVAWFDPQIHETLPYRLVH